MGPAGSYLFVRQDPVDRHGPEHRLPIPIRSLNLDTDT